MKWRSADTVRGAGWLAVGYGARTAAYLGITVVLGRELGPAAFGAVALFIALGNGIAFVAGTWPFISVPLMVAEGRSAASAFGPALLLALAGAVLGAALVLPLSARLLTDGPDVLILLSVYALGLLVLNGVYAVLQAYERMRSIALLQSFERTASLAVLAVLALTVGLGATDAQLVLSAVVLACGGIAVAVLARRVRLVRLEDLGRAGLGQVISRTGWLAVVTAASYLVASVDVVVLALFVSDAEVGVYALAYQVYAAVLQLGSLWLVAALPSHARAAARGASIVVPEPSRLAAAAALWGSGVGLLAVTGALAVPAVFGSQFERSVGPLTLLLASAALLAPFFAATPVLVAAGRSRRLAAACAGCAGLNLALDFLLAPALGIWGPAVATCAQSLAAVGLVAGAAFGRGANGKALAAALPVTLATGLLAAGPDRAGLIALAAVVTTLTLAAAVRWLSRPGPPASTPGPEPAAAATEGGSAGTGAALSATVSGVSADAGSPRTQPGTTPASG